MGRQTGSRGAGQEPASSKAAAAAAVPAAAIRATCPALQHNRNASRRPHLRLHNDVQRARHGGPRRIGHAAAARQRLQLRQQLAQRAVRLAQAGGCRGVVAKLSQPPGVHQRRQILPYHCCINRVPPAAGAGRQRRGGRAAAVQAACLHQLHGAGWAWVGGWFSTDVAPRICRPRRGQSPRRCYRCCPASLPHTNSAQHSRPLPQHGARAC